MATKKLPPVTSQQRTLSHFLFHQGIFYRKRHACCTHTPFFSVPRLNTKLKGRHFDTTEVMKAESQAVLIALTGCI
jgi:hypothetical protein